MGSPFKMMPGGKSGSSRDRGLKQMAQRGLIGEGGPKTHEGGKVHADAKSGDKLPSYNVQTATHKASSKGDGKIKTGKDVGVGQDEVNAYNMKTHGTLTPTKDGLTNNRSSSSSKASTKIKSETKTIGDKTLNQIKSDATIAQDNAISKKEAEAKHETNLRTKDSSAYAQKLYKLKSKYNPTEIDANKIQASADRYAGLMAEKRLSDARFGMSVGQKESNLIKEQIKNNVSQTPRIQ